MAGKLPVKDKIGYSMSGFGEGVIYTIVSTFMLFFLTTVADIKPAVAGTMIAIATVWDALINPVIGYLSDNCHSKLGKRRPFLLMGTFPIAIVTSLMFTYIDASESFKIVYYMIMLMLLWICYSSFFTTYTVLGAEYTDDYNERISLRTYNAVISAFAGSVAGMLPTLLVDIFTSKGGTEYQAWSASGIICGIMAGIAVFIAFLNAKGKDLPCPIKPGEEKEKFNLRRMFTEYLDILKLKPMRLLLAVSIITLMGVVMVGSTRVYYFTYNMGLSGKLVSVMVFITTGYCFLWPPIIDRICQRTDKRKAFMLLTLIPGCCCLIYRFFIRDTDMLPACIILCIGTVSMVAYWQLMPALLYDIIEYDEFTTGKKRAGSLMSLQTLSEAVSEALSMLLIGLVLQGAGFDGELTVQTEQAMLGIENCMFLVPVILMFIAQIFIYKYPITREKFEEIKADLAARNSVEAQTRKTEED